MLSITNFDSQGKFDKAPERPYLLPLVSSKTQYLNTRYIKRKLDCKEDSFLLFLLQLSLKTTIIQQYSVHLSKLSSLFQAPQVTGRCSHSQNSHWDQGRLRGEAPHPFLVLLSPFPPCSSYNPRLLTVLAGWPRVRQKAPTLRQKFPPRIAAPDSFK